MSNIVGLDLNVNQNYIEEAVKNAVMVGITEGMNNKNEITSQIIKMVLETKVNKSGVISSYTNDNKFTLLESYVSKMIREITTEELNILVEEHKEEIKKSIRKELQKQVTIDKFVSRFVDNVSDTVNNSWCPRIEVTFDQYEER